MTVPPTGFSDLPASLMQPQFAFFIIVGVLWLIKAIGRAKAAFLKEERPQQEANRPGPAPRAGPVEASLTDEERALLVRQDILKKRAERQAEAASLRRMAGERQAPVPPTLSRRTPAAALPPPVKTPLVAAYPAAQARIALPQIPAVAPRIGSLAVEAQGPSAAALWLDELRSRDSVRRAILVREILGQPVALR
jgi:hypothetical protein